MERSLQAFWTKVVGLLSCVWMRMKFNKIITKCQQILSILSIFSLSHDCIYNAKILYITVYESNKKKRSHKTSNRLKNTCLMTLISFFRLFFLYFLWSKNDKMTRFYAFFFFFYAIYQFFYIFFYYFYLQYIVSNKSIRISTKVQGEKLEMQ